MADAVFRASVQGYRRVVGRLSAAGRMVQPVINAEFRGRVAPQVLAAARGVAPHDTGLLASELRAPVSSSGGRVRVILRSPVRDPRAPHYAYTNVTRVGWRKKVIKPKRGQFLRFPASTTGRWISVREVHTRNPDHDWVEDVEAEADGITDAAGERIGRVIASRIL
jgi:hypothetical protein